ncbi:UNVERIFIED_CONTAM: hypothetical protein Sindi_2688500 [Sesamum indicum]
MPKPPRGKSRKEKEGDEGGGLFQEALNGIPGQETSVLESECCVHPINCPHHSNSHTEHVCWEKAWGTGLYQKQELDKAKTVKDSSPEPFPKETPRSMTGGRSETHGAPCKEVIRMIAGEPIESDSHHARKAQVREAHNITLKEILDVEALEDFGRVERFGPKTSHNDALVITALLTNYKVGRIFIDLGSSADILFDEAYDQMQFGDIPLEVVNTSLYGFSSRCTISPWHGLTPHDP